MVIFVLRRTNMPAALVECGFLTNPTKAATRKMLLIVKLAGAIAAGVRSRIPSQP